MSIESELPQVARKIVAEPPPILAPFEALPGAELAPPTAEQIRGTEAVFSSESKNPAAGLIGLWSAGMLARELAEDAIANLEKDDDSDENPESPRPD